ncbi:cupin domain-containing protein [Pseudomonas sp. NPDC089734]|uniref:(R)-mandelonitrile lyase n=1 Tax=Pseudomonas sp. NPDC089734 TaxID=3364469 RepID=UPI003824286F
MSNRILGTLVCAMALQITTVNASEPPANETPAVQHITRAGEQASIAGSEQVFTGKARIDPIWSADKNINASAAMVTFEPGARSAWHTHPAGQRLIVTSGVGLTQEWGGPVQVIRPGDVIWCPPGVKHWHGATPETAMTHMAITGMLDGKNVSWMEKVSDEQYRDPRKP